MAIRVLVLGAARRDFREFATVLRDDPGIEVVGLTAAQIPGIDHDPPTLADELRRVLAGLSA